MAKQGKNLNSGRTKQNLMTMDKKKKVRQIVSLLLLASVTLTVPAVAQTSNVVSIPDGLTAASGDNVSTSIMLENSTGVASVGIKLSYNASVVNVTAAAQGGFTAFFGFDNTNAANGWITINTYIMGQDLTGDVKVADVTLEAVGNSGDASPLQIEILTLADQYGADVAGIPDNGSFMVQIQPVITSCNSGGTETNTFAPGESVYVKGSGLESSTQYKIWLQDNPVNEGDSLATEEDDSGSQETVTTDGSGNFGPTTIWAISGGASITHHEYDIVIDNQESGIVGTYNAASDGIDSATAVGITAPVPELSTIFLFSMGVLLLTGYVRQIRRKGNQ
jgi:hypothetical protein